MYKTRCNTLSEKSVPTLWGMQRWEEQPVIIKNQVENVVGPGLDT